MQPNQNTFSFFTETEKKILKFLWKQKISWKGKIILSKKNHVRGTMVPDLELYYKNCDKKQYDTGTKTDMESSGMKLKTQTWTHLTSAMIFNWEMQTKQFWDFIIPQTE